MEAEYKKYLKKLTLLFCLTFFSIVFFNFIVDPFSVFDFIEVSGFNDVKSGDSATERLRQARAVVNKRPEAIIIGSSRSHMGINPGYLKGKYPLDYYNLSFGGANLYEVYRYIQHAHATGNLKEVIVGLDLFMFNYNNFGPKLNSTFREDYLSVGIDGRRQYGTFYLKESLISFDALGFSLETVKKSIRGEEPVYTENGFRNPAARTIRYSRYGGLGETVRHIAVVTFDSIYNSKGKNFTFYGEGLEPLELFEDMVVFLYKNNISTKFFLSPSHAVHLELISRDGLGVVDEKFKREVVRIIEDISSRQENKNKPGLVTLTDFSTFNKYTTEILPPNKDFTSNLKYTIDGSHYSEVTGSLILDRLFELEGWKELESEFFGVELNSETIDRILKEDKKRKNLYEENNPLQVKWLKETMARLAK